MDKRLPAHRLLGELYRTALEEAVSQHYGVKWRIHEFRDMDELASHPSAILSDGSLPVFVKLSESANGMDQFEVELAGMQLLSERAGILTPSPVGIVPVEGAVMLVLMAAQVVERTPSHWREIGRTLARIHQVKGDLWGFEKQGYFGPLYQDNRPARNWMAFFIERRLWPRLIGAIDSGNLPMEIIRKVEQLISRLPTFGISEIEPTLLHGDAQQNNFITTREGVMVIDPAVYYGNPEMDLALVDYFQPVPEEVWNGYRELLPIDRGFNERRELWRVPAYLAVITVGAVDYLDRLTGAVQMYL